MTLPENDYSPLRSLSEIVLDDVWGSVSSEAWTDVQLRMNACCGGLSEAVGGVNLGDRRALFALVRHFKPRNVLEIGTHLGCSTVHIAAALQGLGGGRSLTSVDIIDVNNPAEGAWSRAGLALPPRAMIENLGGGEWTSFLRQDSVEYLSRTDRKFDFIFLDGDHSRTTVYKEIELLPRVMASNAVVLLHDYFPQGESLWSGKAPITGPWEALRDARARWPVVDVLPLGDLPWPTKMNSHRTSLALFGRVDLVGG